MKKQLLASAILTVLATASLSAATDFGFTSQHKVGSESTALGASASMNDITGAVYFGMNDTKEQDGTAGKTKKWQSITLDGRYTLPVELADGTNLIAGASYTTETKKTKANTAATEVEDKTTTIKVNVGATQEVAGFRVDLTTPVYSMSTVKYGAAAITKDQKKTAFFDGLEVTISKNF